MNIEPVGIASGLAGLVSGCLLGLLFRNSEAERRQFEREPPNRGILRYLYAPFLSVRGLLALLVVIPVMVACAWLPRHLLGVDVRSPEARPWNVGGLLLGVLMGWLLRYLTWRVWLRRL
jgi:uncharacterized membrane protein HdeD (DUF308 family)